MHEEWLQATTTECHINHRHATFSGTTQDVLSEFITEQNNITEDVEINGFMKYPEMLYIILIMHIDR